jgi:hypothetical protein
VGRSGEAHDQFLAGLQEDLDDIAAFRKAAGDRATVETFETRPPGDMQDQGEYADLVDTAACACDSEFAGSEVAVFFEPPMQPDRVTAWATTVAGVAATREAAAKNGDRMGSSITRGVKLRCGGLDATAFPSVAELAFAIRSAASADVPLKFTAGLHQPLRHRDETLRADVHGFLNVFVAGCMAYGDDAQDERLREILAVQGPSRIDVGEASFSFGGHTVSCGAISRARAEFVTSFGSCSFQEVVAGMQDLGLLTHGKAD